MNVFKTESDLIEKSILNADVSINPDFIPRSLLLQWHITDRCNFNCRHCYQEGPINKDPDLNFMTGLFDQYIEILKKWKIKSHINFTGGEPFLNHEFLPLLEYTRKYKEYFSYAVLSNGSLIDKTVSMELKKLGCQFVQVSIEGAHDTNDSIRGKGSTELAVNAIKNLRKNKIQTMISFTSHNLNSTEFKDVVKSGRKMKADIVWTDRLIPFGKGKDMKEYMMQPFEVRKFFEDVYNLRINNKINLFNKTLVKMHRALNFIILEEHNEKNIFTYRCSAGRSLITIMPNGDVLPCRRMPVIAGNLKQKSLIEIYSGSILFNNLRENRYPEECNNCESKKTCSGGLRCLSYTYFGNPFKADPQCFLLYDKLPD
jgi:radical SAM protein with 4Fe4S-binding SPASM domain